MHNDYSEYLAKCILRMTFCSQSTICITVETTQHTRQESARVSGSLMQKSVVACPSPSFAGGRVWVSVTGT